MRAVRWEPRWRRITNSTISRAPPVDAAIPCTALILVPSSPQDEIEQRLRAAGARFETLCDCELIAKSADALAEGKALGWFQGRMEFGPRALGARSILGDARSPSMQSVLNLKVKYRESFRPFAPSVLRERVSDYFDLDTDSPYMLLVADVAEHRRLAHDRSRSKNSSESRSSTSRAPIFRLSPTSIIPRAFKPFIATPIPAITR